MDSPALALSPNGSQLVYVARDDKGSRQLYPRPMDSLQARPIPGTEDAVNPFFSPDGQWVGFWSDSKLKKVALAGGSPLTLCEVALPLVGATWGTNDDIVFASVRLSGLFRVPAAGGIPEQVTELDSSGGDPGHLFPEFLPGGKAVIFTSWQLSGTYGAGRISLRHLDTGEQRVLIEDGGIHPHYVPTGHLVYTRAGNLSAAPFDIAGMKVTGSPVSTLGDIMQSASMGAAQLSLSERGILAYIPGGLQADQHTLVLVNRSGESQLISGTRRSFESPRISPDGKRVAVTIRDLNTDLWELGIERGTPSPLTSAAGEDETPLWSSDGQRLFFTSSPAEELRTVSWMAADGRRAEERLLALTSAHHVHLGSWSSDGTTLAFVVIPSDGLDEIWVFQPGRDPEPRPFLNAEARQASPAFSPDGRWLAYTSNRSGQFEIYIQPFPGRGGERQVSTQGGMEPVWAPSGRELFYRQGDRMMVVDVTTQPSLALGSPRLLFEGAYVSTPWPLTNYDVTPDGRSFVMVKAGEQPLERNHINVVLNWFEDLKRLVPADN